MFFCIPYNEFFKRINIRSDLSHSDVEAKYKNQCFCNYQIYKQKSLLNILKRMQRKVRRIYKRALMCFLFPERGELSVEAALTLPVFVCTVIAFMYFFLVMGMDLRIYSAMENVSNDINTTYVLSESFEKTLTSDLNIKLRLLSEVGKDNLASSCISGGVGGLSVSDSCYEEGVLNLVVNYKIKLPLLAGEIGRVKRQLKLKTKLYIGKDLSEKEEYVYITKTGSVYHKSRDCTYLKPSVKSILYIDLCETVNNQGKVYTICDSCLKELNALGKEEEDLDDYDQVFVTDEGEKFHIRNDCYTIKREVEIVKLTEVLDRSACSKCGGADE